LTPDVRTALVTGAGQGLGLEIARRLAAAGVELCLLDRDGATAERALAALGARGLAVQADVTDPDQVAGAVKSATERLAGVDLLVNNAGISGTGPPRPIHETEPEEWAQVLSVNLTGPYLMCRAVLPGMVERGSGIVVNVASAVGVVPLPQRAPYSVSKAALIHLTRCLAAEYSPHGIRANALCPGWIDTPLIRWRLERPELARELLSKVPMGRVASVQEIAAAAVMLASEGSRYMSGAALVVDGGWTVV
jgi:NAD(P)-dependent dehydrogenase (short-subunit alcohol dehydrogenase family)